MLEVFPEKLAVILVESGILNRSVANPVLLMGIFKGLEETQLADVVKSVKLPSVSVPVAENCWLVMPLAK